MLDLFYYKRNPFIRIFVDGSIFVKKKIKTYNWTEKRQKKVLFLLGCFNDEIIINTKIPFLNE